MLSPKYVVNSNYNCATPKIRWLRVGPNWWSNKRAEVALPRRYLHRGSWMWMATAR